MHIDILPIRAGWLNVLEEVLRLCEGILCGNGWDKVNANKSGDSWGAGCEYCGNRIELNRLGLMVGKWWELL